MSKISNTITMLELLNNNKKYTIDELSEKLEVTPRMVRIYKEELDKAGIYIDTVRGPYGGYVLNQSIRVPKRKFNKEDLDLLNDIETKLDNNKKIKLEILKDKIRGIYQGSTIEKNELNKETLPKYNLLTKAIKEKRKVKILYFSYNKGEIERIIYPYDMFLYTNGWGCAAYCTLRHDLRHFELNRIIKCELLSEFYEEDHILPL